MILKRGDIFLSKNPMSLGIAINAVQKLWSKDNKSFYSHAGIITDDKGNTLESLWTVKNQNLFKDYKDAKILVARNKNLDAGQIYQGLYKVEKEHKGQWYPFHRLLFMIVPPISKYVHLGRVVCSELVCKFLKLCGMDIYYYGKNPDDIHDMVKNNKQDWEIIFEGELN